MTGRIEHWERKYRVRHAAAVGRLDALTGPVLAAYEDAVRGALADPDEVVLVRDLHVRLVLTSTGDADAERARAWGRAMATAVLRALARPDAGGVARFPDRAAHLAAFLAAAAHGRATDDWTFARFAACRRPTARETLAAALLAHPALAPAAIRRLRLSGDLPRVVGVLGPLAARVWAETVAGPSPLPAEERPLFAAALALVERLGGAVPRAAAEAWFAEFAAGPRPATDWQDRTHLAEAVAVAVRFVLARSPVAPAPTAAAVAAAVAALDWLDTEWLARRVVAQFAATPPTAPRIAVGRPAPSPRHRDWVAAFHAALPRLAADLDRSDLRSPANALLAFAALTADRPEWLTDLAVPGFVEAVLAAAAGLAAAGGGGSSVPAVRAIEAMGPRAVELARAVAGRTDPARRGGGSRILGPDGIATAAAGAFLLLRAVQDLRLTALAHRAGYPAAGALGAGWLVAALAGRWAGLPLGPDPDPGLLALAGLDAPFDRAAFQAAWADDGGGRRARGFQVALGRTLLGHRLLGDPTRLAVAVVPHPGGWAAFAGDESSQVWPFAAPVDSPDAPLDEWLATWRTEWEAVVGGPVEVARVAAPAALAAAVEALAGESVGDPPADVVLAAAAQSALRAWARWLPRLERASTPYLLGQFIRRPGRIFRAGDGWLVELDPRPLDVALHVSGYLDPIEPLPGTAGPVVQFRIGGA